MIHEDPHFMRLKIVMKFNTPVIIVAVTVPLHCFYNGHYSKTYFGRFQIQIWLVWFFILRPNFHLLGNLNFWNTSKSIQIHMLEDHGKTEFWWIYGFFPKGLNPFKIQTQFQIGFPSWLF
jgi:hypothetical protein